jgi:hypothetical protein
MRSILQFQHESTEGPCAEHTAMGNTIRAATMETMTAALAAAESVRSDAVSNRRPSRAGIRGISLIHWRAGA